MNQRLISFNVKYKKPKNEGLHDYQITIIHTKHMQLSNHSICRHPHVKICLILENGPKITSFLIGFGTREKYCFSIILLCGICPLLYSCVLHLVDCTDVCPHTCSGSVCCNQTVAYMYVPLQAFPVSSSDIVHIFLFGCISYWTFSIPKFMAIILTVHLAR